MKPDDLVSSICTRLTYAELKEVVRFIEAEYFRTTDKAPFMKTAADDLCYAVDHIDKNRNTGRRGAPRKLITAEAKGIATDEAKRSTETTVGR